MSDRITADITTLFDQSLDTAKTYMREAISCIDAAFGDGYAAKHPELVGSFMTTAATDFQTMILGKTIPDALLAFTMSAQALEAIAEKR